MRIAVIADIHGNLPALDAVLADIAMRDVDRMVNLGDVASGPLWPRETVERVAAMRMRMPTVRGNHDRWVAGDDPASMGPSDRFAWHELGQAQREWLGGLPGYLLLADPNIAAFHACPWDDNSYLVERVSNGRLVRNTVEEIAARLGRSSARVVLCGHSHIAQLVQLPGGPLILNPGSVGCPAYDDLHCAEPHVSESGSPHARYAVLTATAASIAIDQIAVVYDWEQAAERAARNGRPEWAHALRTGLMPA
jgi:predicted phosphodiesterase